MTQQQWADHLRFLALSAGLGKENPDALNAHIDSVISLGINSMWYAKGWRFRRDTYTLDTSSGATEYDLPSYVAAIVTAKETESTYGTPLKYVDPVMFDMIVPDPSDYNSNYPQIFTLKLDWDERILTMRFFPVPDVDNVYLTVLKHAPDKPEKVPGNANDALKACMMKHLYPDDPKWLTARKIAYDMADREIKLLERNDHPYGRSMMVGFDMSNWGSGQGFKKRYWEISGGRT